MGGIFLDEIKVEGVLLLAVNTWTQQDYLHLCNLTTFMITAKDSYTIPITHFQRHQQRDCLQ